MSDHNQLPGTGSIADSVEFVKKLWGIPSAGSLPGMLIPTLSLEEINKKIADLKAVESWMTVNMNMLRGTIQALEVQNATIVNLQSMGAMMGGSPQAGAKAASSAGATPGFPFSFPAWPQATAAQSKPEAEPEPAPEPTPEPTPQPWHAAAAAEAAEPVAPAKSPAAVAAAPNAWWDMLQNQFKQAVSTALMPDALTAGAKRAKPVASKSAASKSTPASARKTPAKPTARKAPIRAKAKTPARAARKS